MSMFTFQISECTVINGNPESCFVNLTPKNKNIVLGIAYRPPSGDYRELWYIWRVCNHCTFLSLEEFILCGDFNRNLLNYDNNRASQQFQTSIQSHSLLPTIRKSTRGKDNTATIIDKFFTTSPTDMTHFKIRGPSSEHLKKV